MNGWEFLERFNDLPKEIIQDIKVVILSTSTAPKDIERYNTNGNLLGYLNKPLTKQDLLNVLSKAATL